MHSIAFATASGPFAKVARENHARINTGDILLNVVRQSGGQLRHEDFWQLLLAASKSGKALESALASGEPTHLARSAFQLAQAFNAFYHDYPILAEEDVARKHWRAAGVAYVRSQLTQALSLMGIAVPARM